MKKVEANRSQRLEGMDSYQTIVGLGIVTNTYNPNLRHDLHAVKAMW
jgi:hypothetical protein